MLSVNVAYAMRFDMCTQLLPILIASVSVAVAAAIMGFHRFNRVAGRQADAGSEAPGSESDAAGREADHPGSEPDAGREADAGPEADAGRGADAGPEADAGAPPFMPPFMLPFIPGFEIWVTKSWVKSRRRHRVFHSIDNCGSLCRLSLSLGSRQF